MKETAKTRNYERIYFEALVQALHYRAHGIALQAATYAERQARKSTSNSTASEWSYTANHWQRRAEGLEEQIPALKRQTR